MFETLGKLFARPSINRVVDNGRVHCPVGMRDVDLENCYTCGFLREQRESEAGMEITCTPSLNALVGPDRG